LYEKAFVQQVLGAAVSEELFIFVGFFLTFKLFHLSRVRTEADVVAVAVAVAIGFTTIENVTAVVASGTPLSAALNRLLSIIAGHASL
jgi:RsiW-degrading membrane proteinase PrsW (M82 family)